MNDKYLFIRTNKGEPYPELSAVICADSPQDAIRKAEYFPFGIEDMEDLDFTFTEFESMVFSYYGLIEGTSSWDMGNGQDGTRTVIVCIVSDDDSGRFDHIYPA